MNYAAAVFAISDRNVRFSGNVGAWSLPSYFNPLFCCRFWLPTELDEYVTRSSLFFCVFFLLSFLVVSLSLPLSLSSRGLNCFIIPRPAGFWIGNTWRKNKLPTNSAWLPLFGGSIRRDRGKEIQLSLILSVGTGECFFYLFSRTIEIWHRCYGSW
jgi:hypothetical protein